MNQRFNVHDERIDRLANEASALRNPTIRVNELAPAAKPRSA